MNWPTPAQLDAWAATLHATDWRDLTHQVQVAIERERRGGTALPDGYPTSSRAGSHGGSELTPTEAAAHARIAGIRDEHHDLTLNAVRWLNYVILATNACRNTLTKMETRSVPAGTDPTDCCVNHLRHGYPDAARYRGQLCAWCYRINAEFGFLPTLDLIEKKSRGRIYDRDILAARKQVVRR